MEIKEKDFTISIIEDDDYYSCHVVEHGLYFSSKKVDGIERVKRKANAMVEVKYNFLKEFSQYD